MSEGYLEYYWPDTGRDDISFSAISSYSACPLRYFFRYVQGLPEETVSSSLVFGRAIHEAVEAHFNSSLEGTESPSRDALLTVFWEAWRSAAEEAAIQFPKNEDEQSIAALAERVISAFQESDLAHPEGRVIGIEEELRRPIAPSVPSPLISLPSSTSSTHLPAMSQPHAPDHPAHLTPGAFL